MPDPPEPDVGDAAARLAETVGDPRDKPPPPAKERVEQPSADPARWQAYWVAQQHVYAMNQRYRCGEPYSPLVSLRELDRGRRTPRERRLLERELIVRTGTLVPFDPHDLVPVQSKRSSRGSRCCAGASSRGQAEPITRVTEDVVNRFIRR